MQIFHKPSLTDIPLQRKHEQKQPLISVCPQAECLLSGVGGEPLSDLSRPRQSGVTDSILSQRESECYPEVIM